MAAFLSVDRLVKNFPAPATIGEWVRGVRPVVSAVDGVSFELERGETVGLLGESGCGKTTLGRLLLKLLPSTAGTIRFDGAELDGLAGQELRRFRRRAQLVFQNPFDALDPRFTIRRSLTEPLVNAGIPREQWDGAIATALARVHLSNPEQYLTKLPHQMSGGQLQRVVLARALILEPEFIVADEPVSMLDVSVRAGVLNVLREVRASMGLTAVYISHDLALVRYVCDRTLVMYLGRIVEDGPTAEVIRRPFHPYSRALVQAVPVPRVDQSRAPLDIGSGMPDARHPPSGCRFRDRCPQAIARCAEAEPPLVELAPKHFAACHLLAAQ